MKEWSQHLKNPHHALSSDQHFAVGRKLLGKLQGPAFVALSQSSEVPVADALPQRHAPVRGLPEVILILLQN